MAVRVRHGPFLVGLFNLANEDRLIEPDSFGAPRDHRAARPGGAIAHRMPGGYSQQRSCRGPYESPAIKTSSRFAAPGPGPA